MVKRYVLSVMARDRVGIVSDLTGAVAVLGGNIDAISQTVMRGYFTIIVAVDFSDDVAADELAQAVRAAGATGELEVSVKERQPPPPRPIVEGGQGFVLTIFGPDRKGVIRRVTDYLASRNVNIEDLYAYVEGGVFRLVAELRVPEGLEVERLQMDVGSLWPEGDIRVTLQHENVFLATNDVGFRHRSG
jgi:glycine cleavage system transcriptional repressor